jgi:hypothetical protein
MKGGSSSFFEGGEKFLMENDKLIFFCIKRREVLMKKWRFGGLVGLRVRELNSRGVEWILVKRKNTR